MTHQHYPGDGCTGTPHDLTAAEDHQVREIARVMVADAACSRWDDIVTSGRSLALHYGPHGEWLLTVLLATYVCQGRTPAGPRPPQVNTDIPSGDVAAAELLHTLLNREDRRLESAVAQRDLLYTMRPVAQEIITRGCTQRWDHARVLWEAVYAPRRDMPGPALALTTLLVLWASRRALGLPRVPAQRTVPETAS